MKIILLQVGGGVNGHQFVRPYYYPDPTDDENAPAPVRRRKHVKIPVKYSRPPVKKSRKVEGRRRLNNLNKT